MEPVSLKEMRRLAGLDATEGEIEEIEENSLDLEVDYKAPELSAYAKRSRRHFTIKDFHQTWDCPGEHCQVCGTQFKAQEPLWILKPLRGSTKYPHIACAKCLYYLPMSCLRSEVMYDDTRSGDQVLLNTAARNVVCGEMTLEEAIEEYAFPAAEIKKEIARVEKFKADCLKG